MLKLTPTLKALLDRDGHLLYCFHHRLLNLSQLARFLHGRLETELKKEVSLSAISMALSRLQGELPVGAKRKQFGVQNIAVHANMVVLTFHPSDVKREDINRLYNRLRPVSKPITVTEGSYETMIIVELEQAATVQKIISAKPKYVSGSLASLSLRFDPAYLNTSGFLYQIFEDLALRSISVRQLASTSTELIVYVAAKDAEQAFQIFFKRLSPGSQRRRATS